MEIGSHLFNAWLLSQLRLPVFLVQQPFALQPLNSEAHRWQQSELAAGDAGGAELAARFAAVVRQADHQGCVAARIPAGGAGWLDVVVLRVGTPHPYHLLLLFDSEALAAPPCSVLTRWLGLTWREAQVAAEISRGRNLRQVAQGLGMCMGTVRNHLKAIYSKTGISGQAPLAATLSRIAPFLPPRRSSP